MEGAVDLLGLVDVGLSYASSLAGVREAEVFVSTSEAMMARLSFATDLPCNGLEEPKSLASDGVGATVVVDGIGGLQVGHGYEAGLSAQSVRLAVDRARESRIADPHFVSLPKEKGTVTRLMPDEALFSLDDSRLVDLGWEALAGALDRFAAAGRSGSIIVGGEVSILRERIAVGNTRGIRVDDATARAEANLTAMIEAEEAKGTGWTVSPSLASFVPERAGADAADAALRAEGGLVVADGEYDAVLGPQALADIVDNVLLPSLALSTVDSRRSAFTGKLGRRVAMDGMNLYDDGSTVGGAASRSVTCEGLPAGRTDLIRSGFLEGFLSNHYLCRKLEEAEEAEQKLGAPLSAFPDALEPRNGFRFSGSGSRDYRLRPGIFATNLFMEVKDGLSLRELMSRLGNGLYLGRIWYTYPVNGLARGDFTATVIGDSFLIEGGQPTRPIRANTLRIEENVGRLLREILGGTSSLTPTLLWATPHVAYLPAVAVSGIRCRQIGRFLFDQGGERKSPFAAAAA